MKKFALPILLMLTALSAATAQTATTTNVWTATFTLEVYKRAIPGVATNSVTIDIISGSSDVTIGELVLTNSGNVGLSYTIDSDFSGAIVDYSANYIGNTAGWVGFLPPLDNVIDTNTQFTSWTSNNTSEAMDIGFDFPFYSTTKTMFSAGTHGALNLDGNDVPSNLYGAFGYHVDFFELYELGLPPGAEGVDWGDLTVTTDSIVAPFWSSLAIDTNNIRFQKEDDRLVVSWQGADNLLADGENDLNFQAHLHKDGRIKYLYKFSEDPGTSLIGLQEGANTNVLAPALPQHYQVELTPVTWISLDSTSGTIGGSMNQTINIGVNAETVTAGETFPITINWSDGTSNVVDVVVAANNATYTISTIPAAPSLTADINDIAHTNIAIANTGNSPAQYSITDTDARSGGYTVQPTDLTSYDFPSDLDIAVDFIPEDRDEGVTELLSLPFEFPFFGEIYTNFSVGVNGGIALGESRPMYTYQSWFWYDAMAWSVWRKVQLNIWASDGSGQIAVQTEANPYWLNTLQTTTHNTPQIIGTIPNGGGDRYFPYTEQRLTADAPVRPQFIAPYWADLRYVDNSSIQIRGDDSKLIVTWNNMAHWSNPALSNIVWNGTWPMPIPGQTPAAVAHDQTFQAILHKDGTIVYQYQSLENAEAWTEAIVGLRDTESRIVEPSLFDIGEDMVSFTTNYFVTTNGYELIAGVPNYDAPNLVTNSVITTNVSDLIENVALMFTPNTENIISVSPRTGILQPGETNTLTRIFGDARNIDTPGTFNKNYSIENPGSAVPMNVTLSVIIPSSTSLMKDSDGDGLADVMERRWGTDEFDSDSTYEINLDGSRTITWTAPSGEYKDYDRTYLIQYSTDLTADWIDLTTVTNETTFTDTVNIDLPQVFYRVLVDW